MTNNKDHWYDGWFYDAIIAPNQDKLFAQIKTLIEPESTMIDIGCGTGRLEFILMDKCKSLLGIDLSIRNIDRANLTLLKHPDSKISFRHSGLSEIINAGNEHFDYAVLTYVVHEVNEKERIDLLNEAAKVADRIIIGDYLVPKPKGFGVYISEAIEFIAGRDHYRNYRSYVSNGGIYSLAEKAGLKVINEISNYPLSNHIVVLEK
jgi:SAM-dependent methyltransferase